MSKQVPLRLTEAEMSAVLDHYAKKTPFPLRNYTTPFLSVETETTYNVIVTDAVASEIEELLACEMELIDINL